MAGTREVLFLSEQETESTGLTWREAVDAIEQMLRAHGRGQVVVPAKVSLDMSVTGEYQSGGNAMPAFLAHENIAGMKWVTWSWDNPTRGLPSVMAAIILNEPQTGAPIAIMGGAWITAMRTGAVSAVAYKYLARHDSEILAIIGAGVQGRFQLLALREIMPISEVRIFDIRDASRRAYTKEMSEKTGLKIRPAESVADAVRGADVIITATTANEPLVKVHWLKERGTYICPLGSYQELDFATVKRADKLVVDHTEQTLHRGELAKWVARGMLRESDLYGELGEIVTGKKPGRETADENIVCVPIGMGCDDVALAYRILQIARSKGLGKSLAWP